MYKKVLSLNELKMLKYFKQSQRRILPLLKINNSNAYFSTVTYKKKDMNKKIEKTLKINKPTNANSTEEQIPKDPLKSNLYLQIFSCLKKLNAWDETDSDKKDKINELLKNHNVDFQVNDEQITKLISFNSSETEKNSINADEKLNHLLDNLEKIINEEMSEEEYAEDNETNIRFIRPPHNVQELKKVFEDAEKIYEENKPILFHNDNTIKNEIKEKFVQKIPNYFLMRRLEYSPTGTEILVVGTQRNSNVHSLFLSNVLENYQPDMIAIHLSPDIPLFLNCENDYNKEWKNYVKKKANFEFFVNPLPQTVNDIIMSPKKIEKMIDYTFAMSDDIAISPKLVFSSQNVLSIRNRKQNYSDTHLTPFIYSFNSRVDNFSPIAICDYPILKAIEDAVFSTSINDLKDLFTKVLDEASLHNYFFSLESFKRDIFLTGNVKRMDYTVEVLRHLSHSSKRIILVTNYHYMDTVIDCWKNLDSKVKHLQSFYRANTEELYFVDYIEKLVLVDLMTGSFIQNNFIKHGTFPYQCRRIDSWMTGWLNLLNIWMYYHGHYSELLSGVPFNQDLYNQFLEKFNIGFEKEEDEEEVERKLKEELLRELHQ